jgi:pimeloyl-ACP methyl ester carboxylesterase
VPEKYAAKVIVADMVMFLERAVGEPATVVGHSSGGLIAAGVAARAPERVRGLVLEDPPFFSTLLPRAQKTFNYVALAALTHEFLASGEEDSTGYYLRHSIVWDLFGGLGDTVKNSALRYHRDHPGEPVKIFYMPPSLNELFRAMETYDPRFGDAFYTGSFDDGFDHAATLSQVTCPVAQIHVKPRYDKNGILQAAMSDVEAERTRALLKDAELYRVGTGHGFHFEAPKRFDQIVSDLEERVRK